MIVFEKKKRKKKEKKLGKKEKKKEKELLQRNRGNSIMSLNMSRS